ncbi:hypothetical protein H257_12204 [Aphanomyces astaci]|uniref:Cation-transporting P-type ATPase C-terminal domain-containing protein n=1 Tax=Aphanomyces astaci TaxID=112090 RepID=W4G1C3_APHAT|nr:hypothetical protein H257_12204 [Aphanomyces astaci]ETV72849.1 hypothetical protein H257_12204 [Aphanomyces astaci]|eukprot:XP_009837635.1 hypothetical protein H257_12204 [Aphanomyces astaci]
MSSSGELEPLLSDALRVRGTLSSQWRTDDPQDCSAKPPMVPGSGSPPKHVPIHPQASSSYSTLGLTTLGARHQLVQAVEQQLEQQRKSGHRGLWFGFVDTPMWLLFLSAFIRLAEFAWREHRIGSTHEQSHFGDLVESLFLFLAAVFNGILNMLLYRRESREVAERVHYAVKVLCKTTPPPAAANSPPLKRDSILAPSSCCVACYRDHKWQSIPMNLLVHGDVVALMSGDVSPGRVRLLPLVPPSPPAPDRPSPPSSVTYARGDKIPTTHALPHDMPRTNATFQPQTILNLCGDMHVYLMEETPVLQDVANSMANVERPRTAVQTLQIGGKSLASMLCLIMTVVILVSIGVRAALLPEPVHHVVNHVCLALVDVILCFVSLHTPFVWCMGEVAATSHLLTAFEAILESEATTTSATSATADDMDVYDVEEREQSRLRKTKRSFAVERSWYYFWMTLQFRFMDCADAHRTRYHNGKKNKLMIPYSGVRLLERLGSTTMLCCFDDDVLCEEVPCAEEIFLLNEDTNTILDLHPEPLCTTGEKFEDPKWRVHLPSLKPLGLAILLNDCEDPKTEYIDTLRYLSNDAAAGGFYDSYSTTSPQHELLHCVQQLSGYVRLLPYPRHLLNLAKAIGFRVDDLANFHRRQSIHVIAPRLAYQEHTSDHHDQGQEDTRFRGHLKTHLYSTVVLDKRSQGHQLLSRGHPSLAVSQCSEYWDGKSICPLTKDKRRLILDMYHQWRVEDLDCVALTYAPVAQKCNALFGPQDTAFTKLPPLFLVEESSPTDDDDDHPQHRGTPVVSPGVVGSPPSSTEALKPSAAMSPTNSAKVQTSSAATGVERHTDSLWKLQEDQIFLGMVASGIQPRKGMVGLIEDVTASGIRFVYFSPRNMRRSKLLAEKMGIETDWNCAISLRDSDGPDPHRMTSNYSDWDVKARLPHGMLPIKTHFSMKFNNQSDRLWIGYLVGAIRSPNLYIKSTNYTTTKLSIVVLLRKIWLIFCQIDHSLCGFYMYRSSSGSQLPVFSEVDMELSQMLNTLACAFTVRNFTHTRVSPMVVVDLIRLGRHMLTNFIQLVHYIFVMQLYVATVVCLSYVLPFPEVASLGCMSILWLLWIVVPALSLSLLSSPPDRHIMTRTPRKNEASAWTDDATRLCMYFLVRYVPSAIFVNIVFQVIFGLSLQFAAEAASLNPSHESWWYFANKGPLLFVHPRPPVIMAALDRAEAFLLLAMGWFCIFSSISHCYRSYSIFSESPFRNHPWMLTCVVCVVLQIGVSVWRAGGLVGGDGLALDAFVRFIPGYVWLALGVWPILVVLVDELAKQHDHRLLIRYYKFLRMQFDTRLGMWSPK